MHARYGTRCNSREILGRTLVLLAVCVVWAASAASAGETLGEGEIRVTFPDGTTATMGVETYLKYFAGAPQPQANSEPAADRPSTPAPLPADPKSVPPEQDAAATPLYRQMEAVSAGSGAPAGSTPPPQKTAQESGKDRETEMQAWVNAQPIKLGEKLTKKWKVDALWEVQQGSSLMVFAAMQGRVDVMEWLWSKGEDIMGNVGSRDLTSMHHAAWGGHVAALEWLKSHGMDINSKGEYGIGPIHAAALGGHIAALEWLESNGADVNAKGKNDAPPMAFAALGGHVAALEWLKANGADVNVDVKRHDGRTVMHEAAAYGHIAAMAWLKSHGVDVNAKNKDGKTPFDAADNDDVKQWLTENGGKSGKELATNKPSTPAAPPADPQPALERDSAATPLYRQMEAALAGGGTPSTPPPPNAARETDKDRETEMQAWVNAQPIKLGEKLTKEWKVDALWEVQRGSSLMAFAAVQGRVDVMEWLWSKDEDITGNVGSRNLTSMHHAAWGGHVAALEWLKSHGMDVNRLMRLGGQTPMHAAALGGHVAALEWLKANGAEVNGGNNGGGLPPPISFAAVRGHIAALEWFKANGADVNVKLIAGNTLMHGAARGGHSAALQWLKANGADVNVKNNDGETPYDVAGTDDIKKWLAENGGKSGR